MIKNNKVKIIGVILSIILLVIVITSSFAYFGLFNVNLTGAANLTTICTYDIVYEYDSSSYIYGRTGTILDPYHIG